jgi:hypothetical protein
MGLVGGRGIHLCSIAVLIIALCLLIHSHNDKYIHIINYAVIAGPARIQRPINTRPSRSYVYEREGLVGVRGFEPPTSQSRTERSTKLSHTPTTTKSIS